MRVRFLCKCVSKSIYKNAILIRTFMEGEVVRVYEPFTKDRYVYKSRCGKLIYIDKKLVAKVN